MEILKKLLGINQKKVDYYKKGIHFYNQSDLPMAIHFFELHLKKKNRSKSIETRLAKFYCERAYVTLGLGHFIRHENTQALNHFQKAYAFSPNAPDLNYFIGICLNNVGRYKDAIQSFSRIRENGTADIPGKLKLSIVFYNLGMWKTAEKIQKAILATNSEFADVHFHLGLSFLSQGRMTDAVRSFESALRINPKYTGAHLKMGTVLYCMGDYDAALRHLEELIFNHPRYADAYYIMGLIKEKSGEIEQGIECLKLALEISPRFKNSLIKLTIFYCRLDRLEQAKEALKNADLLYPNDKRVLLLKQHLNLFQRAVRTETEKNKKVNIGELSLMELRDEFNDHLDIIPNVSEIINVFNNSKYAKSDPSLPNTLIPLIREQIAKNPSFPDLYNALGTQFLFSGKAEKAEKAFAKSVELNPEYVQARINLLKTLYHNKKYDAALVHGEYFLAQRVNFPDVYYTFAQILIELGRYADAITYAKAALRKSIGMRKALILLARIQGYNGNFKAGIALVKSYLNGSTDVAGVAEARLLLFQFCGKSE